MQPTEILELRRELRRLGSAIRRGDEKQRARFARRDEIIQRLVEHAGIPAAQLARDAGVTRMAVSQRLPNGGRAKARRKR